MDDSECVDELTVPVSSLNSSGSRKRKKNKDNWNKNLRKYARNSAESAGSPSINCKHKDGQTVCMAYQLTQDDVSSFFNKIYKFKTAAEQNLFVIKYIQSQEKKSQRPRNKDSPRSRSVTKYFIRRANGVICNVCSATFLSITRFSRKRINKLSINLKLSGELPTEKRGGSRVKPKDSETTISIIEFIKSLKCCESHYGRGKSVRGYLSPDLSIKKLWRIWKEKEQQQDKPLASYGKFFKIFETKFNLGFCNPKSDVCSFCDLTKEKIKACKDLREKARLITEYRLHKLKAAKFYDLLKREESDTIKVSFDMQQNQPLPKLRVGETFYSRQIWVYNLTFVEMQEKQDTSNTFIYTWTEDQSGRGSNEVVSALNSFLGILEEKYKHVPEKSLTLKLFSDSCSGQNKNQNMLGFLLYYSHISRAFKHIEHCFPIRGHSFMPPDRVFGRLEKKFRKLETILEPGDYYTIFANSGTVKVLNKDWQLFDFMKASKQVLRKKLPFLMREQRVFVFSNERQISNIQSKNTYCGSLNLFSIVQKGKAEQMKEVYSKLDHIPNSNHISEKKKKDVENLLQFVNLSESAQKYYNEALASTVDGDNDNNIVVYDELEPFI